MPKILRILNRLNIGGPTYNIAYLSKYISPDFQTKVLAGIKEPYEGDSSYLLNNLQVPFDYVPGMYRSIHLSKDLKAFNHIRRIVNEFKPDVVHTHAAKAGLLGRLAAHYSTARPKIVHTYHGNVFDGYFSPLKTRLILNVERRLCRMSDAIIAISDQQKNDLVDKYALASPDKVHVIKLGFDLNKFTEDDKDKRVKFRRFYHIAEDETVITITGRLTLVKNHALLIEAIKILRAQNPGLKFKLFIVGDGELLEPIIALIEQSGLTYCRAGEEHYNADVIFTSWRKDIDVINAGSDIIALTSLNEGTPVSIIEALAAGKAVVCTDVGGVKDVVKDGYTGLLCEQNAGMLAEKLKTLMENEELRLMLAGNGKKSATQNYSYERLVKETENLYKNLLY
jgi:glycosyltransferase involved in cell wall biosynthesis